MDIIYFRISAPGPGYPRPGMDNGHPHQEVDTHARGWISTPGRGCPRPGVLYNILNNVPQLNIAIK
jgi:hypothetical protein